MPICQDCGVEIPEGYVHVERGRSYHWSLPTNWDHPMFRDFRLPRENEEDC